MKRLAHLTAAALAAVIALPLAAQPARRTSTHGFASDSQTVPVMANTTGVGGATFQSYVALLNPTAAAYPVVATLHDAAGTMQTATINLAAGELRTYDNFLETVFHSTGGGAVTFRSADTTGGTHNNRFIVSTEIWTGGDDQYSTAVPSLEFAGTASPSFSPGVRVDARTRTNIGCFNESGAVNHIRARVFDRTGQQTLGTVGLTLLPHAWTQTAVTTVVTDGYIEFVPDEPAVCYAVIVSNATNDARFVQAVEYLP